MSFNSRFLFLITYITLYALVITACSTQTEPPIDETGLINHQLSGNTAIGIAAQYASLCTLQAQPICTRANRNGDYILNDVDTNQGWLESIYVNSIGEITTLHSAYFLAESIFDGIVNINPTTDIISQIWLASDQNIDLNTCIDTQCFTTTQTLLDETTFNLIEINLAEVLRPFWPVSSGSIRIDNYLADPFSNPLDLMHELINYDLDFTNSLLFIRDNNQNLLAQIPLEELINEEFDAQAFDIVLEAEMQNASNYPRASPSGSEVINITLEINPSVNGSAPFTYEIDTSQTSTTLPSVTLSFEHFIIAPDANITTWTDTNHSGTLRLGGIYDVIVEVTASTGERSIRGAIITLDRDENTPATYGNTGSCRPESITKNDLNLCIELLDGAEIKNCDENDTYIHVNNRCSQTTQLNGAYIGQCAIVDTQVRRTHYQNPLKFSAESTAEQISRLSQVCEADFGIWTE
ncbi:hypothetical protein [Marinicellulosiphila megalodicopiae]|uniref:hypothetical protein n=1 Tax=Marinicellulosiphila megalodicopiae TaxID=2724896 RepID=UPI003BB09A0D